MLRFYQESDAFTFELIPWNTRRFKRSMRRWSRAFLRRERDRVGRRLRVLCHGDGLGVDAAGLALDGHDVTYFEFPGASERYARRVFDRLSVAADVVTDEAKIGGDFDAATCFDVLEHVPDPRQAVADLAGRLRDPDGLLLVHAPFYLIHPAYSTHLAANRRHAGSTRLYEREGLVLLDGQSAWNPLALRRGGDAGRASAGRRRWLRAVGVAMKIGRHTTLPFAPLQRLARR